MSRENSRHAAHAYSSGAPMIGIFSGDLKSVTAILKEADSVRLRETMEPVGGSLCHVIEASGKNGRYTVWVDPEHGYNISRASVRKTAGDIAFGERMGPKDPPVLIPGTTDVRPEFINYSFDLDNVRFEEIDGAWVPMEADFDVMIEYENHEITKEKRHHKRLSVELDPDFEAMGAFVADLPDGVPIVFPEFPGVRYMWQDGRAVPKIDKFVLDSVEQVVVEQKSDVQVEFASIVGETSDNPDKKIQTSTTLKTDTSIPARPVTLLSLMGSPATLFIAGCLMIVVGLLWRLSYRLRTKTSNCHCKNCRKI
jgi:hypothetical protein